MSPARSKAPATIVGGLPQVNLLPPEIVAARGLRVVKRWLGIALVVVLVVIAGLYAWAVFTKSTAEGELKLAEADTEVLLLEQRKYDEVPGVLAMLDNSRSSLWLATSTEVLWEPYLRALASTLPDEVSFDTISYTGATPLEPPQGPLDPLQDPSVGRLTFTARSETMPDTAKWIDELNAIPGLADAWFSDATITEEDETIFYVVNASVQVSESAWAQRYVPVTATESEAGK